MRRVCATAAGYAALGLIVAPSARGAFSPTMKFSPSTHEAGANPRLSIRIAQPPGDEPIDKVTFLLPRGFRFPPDSAISNGETLGHGQFTTAFGPLCSAALQQSFSSTAYERDRTAEEKAAGVWSVWVIDLEAVKVDLVFHRARTGSWRAVADVPNSPLVCPPDTLTATLNRRSSVSRAKIWQNPKKPGTYTLTSIFHSAHGSRETVKQKIKFTK